MHKSEKHRIPQKNQCISNCVQLFILIVEYVLKTY